jgi:ubiquinol-cytochrome c reductase cytochrome c subunit
MRLWILCFCCAIATVLSGQTPATRTTAPAGSAQNGKTLFANVGCYQCHGFEGQGGVGPRLAPRPIAFAPFNKYLRQPTGEMPPYTAKVVTDKDLVDIYSFLQSIPEPPSPESIPILRK